MQPSQGSFGSLYYALGLNIECQNDTFSLAEPSAPVAPVFPIKQDSNGDTYYVDYNAGNDVNPGSEAAPFKTLLKGVLTARGNPGANTIVMRNGTHFINETIEFTPEDSYLTIQACGVVLLSMHLVDRVFRTILARRRF